MKILFPFLLFPLFLLAQSETEPNDNVSSANPIDLGVTYNPFIGAVQDQDNFSFTITEPGIIKLIVSSVPPNINLRSVISNDFGGNEIERTNGSQGTGYLSEVSVCEAGTYNVYFSDLDFGTLGDDFNTETPYSFQVEFIPFAGVDDGECNASFSQAYPIPFGQSISGLISSPFDNTPVERDEDYFRLPVSEPGVIQVTVLNIPPGVTLAASLYGPLQNFWNRALSADGSGIFYEISTCEIGDHYLLLRDFVTTGGGDDFNNESPYSLRVDFIPFAGVDDCECENESFSQACLIPTAESISALLAPPFSGPNQFDRDFYRFSVTEPSLISVTVFNSPPGVRFDASVYTPNQNILRNALGPLDQGFTFEVSTCEIGDHYLYLRDNDLISDDFNSEAPYNFRVFVVPQSGLDPYECNETFASASPIDLCEKVVAAFGAYNGPANNDTDVDYYEVSLTADSSVDLSISQFDPEVRPRLRILNSNNVEVAAYNSFDGSPIEESFTPEESGTYYLRVFDGGNDQGGVYVYRLSIGCNLVSSVPPYTPLNAANIYPNPANDVMILDLNNYSFQQGELLLRSVKGTIAFRQTITATNQRVDLSGLSSGMYLVEIRGDQRVFTGKLVKQ